MSDDGNRANSVLSPQSSVLDVVAMGESLVEFFADEPMATAPAFTKAVGGDTFNMCCAAARIGGRSGYVTRVGDDPFADYLLGTWRGAGVDTSRAPVVEGFNGVYFISNFGDGQRPYAALPEAERTRWRSLAVIGAACGGCGDAPTDADIRDFAQQWLQDQRHRATLLGGITHLGFAMAVDGEGRKIALTVLGNRP